MNGIEVKKPEGLDENSKDTEENRGKLLDFINANLKHLINGDFGMYICMCKYYTDDHVRLFIMKSIQGFAPSIKLVLPWKLATNFTYL